MSETALRYSCPACLAVFRTAFSRCPLDGTALEPLSDDPLVGATFAERYVVEACVGEGAMGRVYRARHSRVSRHFAVKVLFGDHAADRKMQARFAREAEAASRLEHPSVVPVLDFGETSGGVLYLVMDYVEGAPLSDAIADEGPLEPERARQIARHLASGLAHAHERGLVHRDFKAENVLVAGEGDDELARIADFGIAFLFEGESGGSRLTTDGIVMGTPAYMAPEQAVRGEIDHRTDLFSLGVVLYEMLAGVLPFQGPPMEVARKNLNERPPPIAERAPNAPGDAELEAIAMRLMAKDPAERFQSARDLVRALRGESGPARAGSSEVSPVRARSARAPEGGAGGSEADRGNDHTDVAAKEGQGEGSSEAGAVRIGTDQTMHAPSYARRRTGGRRRRAAARIAALALSAAALGAVFWASGRVIVSDSERPAQREAPAATESAEARARADSREEGERGADETAPGDEADEGKSGSEALEGAADGAERAEREGRDGYDGDGGEAAEAIDGEQSEGGAARSGGGGRRADSSGGDRSAGDGRVASTEREGDERGEDEREEDERVEDGRQETEDGEDDEPGAPEGEEAAKPALDEQREVSHDAFAFRYRAVGAALEAAGERERAGALRERYRAVPYSRAVRDAAVRAQAYRELRAIEAELREMGMDL